VKLVGVAFCLVHLLGNNFVKVSFGLKFPGENKISGRGNPNLASPPGNSLCRSACVAEWLQSPPLTREDLGSIPRDGKLDSGFHPSEVGKMSCN